MVETVEYGGRTWRRYPESKRLEDRRYFTSHKLTGKIPKRLHRQMWEDAFGPIPDGCHIHHIDGDTGHNALDNFACLAAGAHISGHVRQNPRTVSPKTRAGAIAWHKSAAGRKWHSKQSRENWRKAPFVAKTCVVCGKIFESKRPATVCSNACFSEQRRRSGIDNETRRCRWCGEDFDCNKYSKQAFCCRSCNTRNTNANRLQSRR